MADQEEKAAQEAALGMMKAVYDDGEAEINGRTYQFLKMKHKKRRKVFAFFSRIQGMIAANDFSFMDSPDFEPVEAVIEDAVMIDNSLLSKLEDHWDRHPEDYIMFVITALGAISYPFLPVSRIDSAFG